MRTAATIFVLLAASAAIYWFMVRPLLRQWADYASLHSTLSEVDATLWFRIKMSFKGLRTILWSRFLVIAPLLLAALQFVEAIDMTLWLPPKYVPYAPLFVALIGMASEWLRRVSSTPAESPVASERAVVEVPTIVGKPDVAIVSDGPTVVAVADTVKAPAATSTMVTVVPTVAEVVKASEAGETVVVQSKEPV